jgi:hypothetical protein
MRKAAIVGTAVVVAVMSGVGGIGLAGVVAVVVTMGWIVTHGGPPARLSRSSGPICLAVSRLR